MITKHCSIGRIAIGYIKIVQFALNSESLKTLKNISEILDFLSENFAMKILGECKAILLVLGFSTQKYIRMINLNIPRLFVRCIIIITLALMVLCGIVCARQNIQHGLTSILTPAGTALSFFAQIIIYVSLLMKMHEIINLLDYLEHVLNKRNCFI